jgi:hypothetical protein
MFYLTSAKAPFALPVLSSHFCPKIYILKIYPLNIGFVGSHFQPLDSIRAYLHTFLYQEPSILISNSTNPLVPFQDEYGLMLETPHARLTSIP